MTLTNRVSDRYIAKQATLIKLPPKLTKAIKQRCYSVFAAVSIAKIKHWMPYYKLLKEAEDKVTEIISRKDQLKAKVFAGETVQFPYKVEWKDTTIHRYIRIVRDVFGKLCIYRDGEQVELDEPITDKEVWDTFCDMLYDADMDIKGYMLDEAEKKIAELKPYVLPGQSTKLPSSDYDIPILAGDLPYDIWNPGFYSITLNFDIIKGPYLGQWNWVNKTLSIGIPDILGDRRGEIEHLIMGIHMLSIPNKIDDLNSIIEHEVRHLVQTALQHATGDNRAGIPKFEGDKDLEQYDAIGVNYDWSKQVEHPLRDVEHETRLADEVLEFKKYWGIQKQEGGSAKGLFERWLRQGDFWVKMKKHRPDRYKKAVAQFYKMVFE